MRDRAHCVSKASATGSGSPPAAGLVLNGGGPARPKGRPRFPPDPALSDPKAALARVFISYSPRDRAAARRLADALAVRGHQPWLDEWEIRVGDPAASKIEAAISRADRVVILLSDGAIRSGWADRELRTTLRDEVGRDEPRILIALLDGTAVPESLHGAPVAQFRAGHPEDPGKLCDAIEHPAG